MLGDVCFTRGSQVMRGYNKLYGIHGIRFLLIHGTTSKSSQVCEFVFMWHFSHLLYILFTSIKLSILLSLRLVYRREDTNKDENN